MAAKAAHAVERSVSQGPHASTSDVTVTEALGQQPPATWVPLVVYRLTAEGIETPADPPSPVQLSFDDLIV